MKQSSRSPISAAARRSWTLASLAAIFLSGCSLGITPAAVKNPNAPALQFVGAWGTKGSDPGQLDQPASIATDARGNVYIADAGSQFIHKFQPGGTPLLSFQDGRLKHPQSIAVDPGGAIYVSDPVRGSVFIFLPDGSRYRELHLSTRPNEENTLDVTVADDGSMSVLDVSAAKVFAFGPTLRLQHVWKPGDGAPPGPGRPRAIAAGPADDVFVGGISANSLLRYDEGKFESQITLNPAPVPNGSAGQSSDSASTALSSPPSSDASSNAANQFAVSGNYIFLADADGKTLHVWTLDGTPKADLDLSSQLGANQHQAPPIAVSPMGDLLVLDAQQSRVLRYHINL